MLHRNKNHDRMNICQTCLSGRESGMRTSRKLLFTLFLAVQSFWAFGHDWVGGVKDPFAEQLYRKELEHQLLPVAVAVLILLLMWLVHVARRKASECSHENANSYDI
jgi:hypothetical protein